MIADWLLLKANATSLLPGVGVSILVLLTVVFFDPQPHIFVTALCLFSMLWEARSNYKQQILPRWQDVVKRQAFLILYMLFMIYLSAFFGLWGIIGVIISSVIIAGIILYRQRYKYLEVLRSIETMVWGKPFDKKEERK